MMPAIHGVVDKDAEEPSLVFHAITMNPDTGVMTPVLVGNGTITCSHGNTSGGIRYGGDWTAHLSNQPTWDGARVVENVQPYSQAFNSWVKTNVTVVTGKTDPLGGTTACEVTSTAANGALYTVIFTATNSLTYEDFIGSVWIRRVSGTGVVEIGSLDTYNKGICTLTDEWQRFTRIVDAGYAVEQHGFEIEMRESGDKIEVAFAQVERIPKGGYGIGQNLCMNPSFDDESFWVRNTGVASCWEITGGKLYGDGGGANYDLIGTPVAFNTNIIYKIVFDVKSVIQNCRLRIQQGTPNSSNYQMYDDTELQQGDRLIRYIQPTQNSTLFNFSCESHRFNGSLDNLYIYPTEFTASEYVANTGGYGTSTKQYYGTKITNSVQLRLLTEQSVAELEEQPWMVHVPSMSSKVSYSNNLANNTYWYKQNYFISQNQYGIMDGLRGGASTFQDDNTSLQSYYRHLPVITPNSYILYFWTIARPENSDNTDDYVLTEFVDAGLWGDGTNKVGIKVYLENGTYEVFASGGEYSLDAIVTEGWMRIICVLKTSGASQSRWDAYSAHSAGTSTGNLIHGNLECYDNIPAIYAKASYWRNLPPYISTGTATLDNTDISFLYSNHDQTRGAYYIEWQPPFSSAEASAQFGGTSFPIISLNSASSMIYYWADGNEFAGYDGTDYTTEIGDFEAYDTVRLAILWDTVANKKQICVNGVWGSVKTYDGTWVTDSTLKVCAHHSGNAELPFKVREFRRYDADYDTNYAWITKFMELRRVKNL